MGVAPLAWLETVACVDWVSRIDKEEPPLNTFDIDGMTFPRLVEPGFSRLEDCVALVASPVLMLCSPEVSI